MNNILLYIICFALSYLFGTIPGAYLIGRLFGRLDIRKEGTGNVGAMNTYEVTGRKSLGVAVLAIDAIKGIGAIISVYFLLGSDFWLMCTSSSAVLLGHNYNIFLKFHGGRGLATAAGLSIILNPMILISWILMYIAGIYTVKNHVHIGSVSGTLLCCFLIYLTPELVTNSLDVLIDMNKNELLTLSGILCAIIMSRHIKPLFDLLKENKAA